LAPPLEKFYQAKSLVISFYRTDGVEERAREPFAAVDRVERSPF
jgi:hypothetical protein